MIHGHRELSAVCAVVFALAEHAGAAPKLVPGHTTVLPLSEGPHLPETSATAYYWTPNASDLRLLDANLPKRLVPYYRQYLGITERGRRLIYINGFSAGDATQFTGGPYDWHRHAVVVEDGGDNFFHATYDPALRKVTRLLFNGPYSFVPKKHH